MRWIGGGEEKRGGRGMLGVWDRLSLEGNQSSLGLRRLQGGKYTHTHAHRHKHTLRDHPS